MQTFLYVITYLCGFLFLWIVFLYTISIPEKRRKWIKQVTHFQAQANYYHELANKANELNSNLKKRIDEYLEIEQKKSIDQFKKNRRGPHE